ncbi:transcriptional regulator [uncultured Veillonella sp.]|uniref:transcriptional regulator n=1 Tax=uncultured Veillonella sp. TaxID=159268 RepID=UPI00263283F2|nr:transcriptional regulator [uncultured Veillonella sp.]
MRRIIITAILTVICAVGAVTSFAVNDLPNFGEWMKTNEQQFRKPHRHDGPNKYMDKHMMDGNNQMMPQGGMGPNNGKHMHQNGQNQMMHQDGMRPNNGRRMDSNGQIPPQGQPLPGGQPNGNVPQQPTGQGAPQTTQNQ